MSTSGLIFIYGFLFGLLVSGLLVAVAACLFREQAPPDDYPHSRVHRPRDPQI